MKDVLIICGAALICILIPFLLISVHTAQMDSYTQSFAEVSTPAGVTSANVTLSLELYSGNIANVSGCSSNISNDTPAAAGYNAVSKTLLVGGLISGGTRTLVVEYGISSEVLSANPGMSPVLIAVVWFFILGVLGLIVAGLLRAFKLI